MGVGLPQGDQRDDQDEDYDNSCISVRGSDGIFKIILIVLSDSCGSSVDGMLFVCIIEEIIANIIHYNKIIKNFDRTH